MLGDGPCQVTGKPGIIDLETCPSLCACKSPLMAIYCDGNFKDGSGSYPETMAKLMQELLPGNG